MAAISSLVLTDAIPSRDRVEEVDTPTTPRAGRYPSALRDNVDVALEDHDSARRSSTSTVSQAPSQGHIMGLTDRRDHVPDRRDSVDDGASIMDLDDDDDASDNEDPEQGEADGTSRKKKGQRFFCTGYPPCSLSFTRSEHLARHIRKHTGERPFQCHCNRRFSRLDNLRQHAQTVHVNEEIPTDSLAATGTRFQRQIRTDRVRPTGRPRTGTAGSGGGHSRGHSRNLSTSSIGSTSSNYSVVTDAKRRPPPLLMASDGTSRPNMGIDGPQTPPSQYRGYDSNSPGGMSTPTSANFSATPGSPGFLSSMGSPTSTHSRLGGFFGSPSHARRLSVPSGPNPYQSQYPPGYPMAYVNNMGPSSSHGSSNSSVLASPTSGSFPIAPGQHLPPGEDWRRRTWHPSTMPVANFNYGRPATSGLTYSQTPDAPQPSAAQHATAAAGQAPRLPGIESFDHVQHRSYTPPRRQPSPMQIDPNLADVHPRSSGHNHGAGSWGQQTISEIQSVGVRQHDPPRHMDMGPPPMTIQQHQQMAREALEAQSQVRNSKRQAWYNGPAPPARTSPEDSSSSDGIPTPGMTAVEVHPMIMHSGGYMEAQHPVLGPDVHQNVCLAPAPYIEPGRQDTAPSFHDRASRGSDMNRLEALVAVATSENGPR
ncbi:Cys2His2 zinc finger developmental/cell cycle regulator [Exophiala viscosa]|uniref:Cys2His2 zinc finger developmental/cell cycle regulator n=1 Tax=Exophiala viscosa TaxID=2486360 RepID=A0AAN6DVR2_9EURO|nr:Cys2His2 zinc finger developmental/cell cycle regulator [Exophiala viscosa]